ncbi:MAG: tetratricopeptide repeat protein [bacterium]
MAEKTDTKSIKRYIKLLEKRYRKNVGSHLFFPLADAYTTAQMYDAAEALLREGLSYHPKYCSAKALLGEILLRRGNLKDAQEELEQVVQMVPENAMAHKLLLETYQKIGSKEGQEKEMRILQMINRQKASAEDIALITKPVLETQSGTSEPVMAKETTSDKTKIKDLSEIVKEQKKRPLDTKEISEEMPQKKPYMPLAKEEDQTEIITATLAELYFNQGFIDKAIDIYRKLLDQNPDNQEWANRLKQIIEMQDSIEMGSESTSEEMEAADKVSDEGHLMNNLEEVLESPIEGIHEVEPEGVNEGPEALELTQSDTEEEITVDDMLEEIPDASKEDIKEDIKAEEPVKKPAAQEPVIKEGNERILEILETWLKNIQKIKKTLN